MNLNAKDITAATGGWVEQLGEASATGVSIDSRTIREGDVFFALRGPNFDGHSFLGEAVDRGAAGLVVEEKADIPGSILTAAGNGRGLFIIRVGDTTKAMGDLAKDYRSNFKGKVVAVTGSNGKTTVKEMIYSILGVRWKVSKSPGNYNNLIGVPLSIFGAGEDHQALVLEAGMNRPGEISRLADIASPDIGVINSIAQAHLERLKDISGIKEAKGELLEGMKATGTAVLNAADPNVMALAPKFKGRILTFGIRPGADVRADKMVSRVDGSTSFDLVGSEGRIRVKLTFLGLHNIYNSLAAAATAMSQGFSLEEIRKGLSQCRPLGMRLELISLPGGIRIINDAYNANPGSVKAAVETFFNLVARERRFVLLGDMLELGEQSSTAHKEIGTIMAQRGVDVLLTLGKESASAAKAFESAAGPGQKSYHYPDHQKVAEFLIQEMESGDMLLVKGSREMALEKVIQTMKSLVKDAHSQEKDGA